MTPKKRSMNKASLELSDRAHHAGEMLGQKLLTASDKEGGRHPEAIYVMCCAVIGILHVLAMTVGKHDASMPKEDFDPTKSINPTTLLFSTLLANKVAPDYCHRSGGIQTEFGPHVIFEALEAYEKLTGRKPDDYLTPGMVSAAREAGTIGREVLNAFMDARRNNPNISDSLN